MLTSPRLLPFLLSIPLVLPSLTGSISSSARLSLLSSGLALQQPRCAIRGFYGHTCAFAHFGGVPWRISYDNLSTAVQVMVRGKGRRENQTFVSFRSYYLFESHFCHPASKMISVGSAGNSRPLGRCGSMNVLSCAVFRPLPTIVVRRQAPGSMDTVW